MVVVLSYILALHQTEAPDRMRRTTVILGSRKNRGPEERALWTKAHPWRLQSIRGRPPAHLCPLFVRTESGPLPLHHCASFMF